MAGCITDDYREILKNLVATEIEKQALIAIVDVIPRCPPGGPSAPDPGLKLPGTRHAAEPWGIEPVYIDAEGKSEKFSSPSALVKHLGLPMSGTVCDASGTKCRATSAIDILRISGYTVSGDGEPRKASEGGKKLTVYHPDALKETEE